jgi:hypothetical protein
MVADHVRIIARNIATYVYYNTEKGRARLLNIWSTVGELSMILPALDHSIG